jgi:hypothetical protein
MGGSRVPEVREELVAAGDVRGLTERLPAGAQTPAVRQTAVRQIAIRQIAIRLAVDRTPRP